MTPCEARPLTPRQAEVFRLIGESVATRGRPPTLRELMADTGIGNMNGVKGHLILLERKGLIRLTRPAETGRGRHVACGIEVVGLAAVIGGVVRKFVRNRIEDHNTGG